MDFLLILAALIFLVVGWAAARAFTSQRRAAARERRGERIDIT